MRILIADNEVCRVLDSQMLTKLAKCGRVDIVQSGRDAVVAYVKNGADGAFYDLVVLDQHLTVLDGFATVEMIRTFESDHRRSGKRTMICVISGDRSFPKQYETCFAKDERTHLIGKPVNLDLIESLADSVAAELEVKSHTNFVPMRMRESLSLHA